MTPHFLVHWLACIDDANQSAPGVQDVLVVH
jgi:hypothetical protein